MSKKNTVAASVAVNTLASMLAGAREKLPESEMSNMGACIFTSAGVTACLNMTKSECDGFNGT